MRRTRIAFLLMVLLVSAACGGSNNGGGDLSAAKAALSNSFIDFGTVVATGAFTPCFNGSWTICPCPGGGQAVIDLAQQTLQLQQCQSQNGLNYVGTIDFNADQTSFSAQLATYGDCTGATIANVTMQSACGGEVTGYCMGATVSCPVAQDPNNANLCILQCS